ncbi:putative Small nuclear ribonucleoprotein B [Giardia muris]|uniref:Putative Small nuclear ribonucleoprotein B n=1 Tax=Giardia muris TaxID=5742 RepID=A0A4Z1SMI1_GIAMU|nr:putative Small nuclear ribonucleoprotein B [Giardia muris]|eukprot:TNJ26896.1 putative Small nuclear ribonucleoprotein B [Giardia muris]
MTDRLDVSLLNHPVTVHGLNGYTYTGRLLDMDRHMNLLLDDCALRKRPGKEQTGLPSQLGLVALRGTEVAFIVEDSLLLDAPPPSSSQKEPTVTVPPSKQPRLAIPGLIRRSQ